MAPSGDESSDAFVQRQWERRVLRASGPAAQVLHIKPATHDSDAVSHGGRWKRQRLACCGTAKHGMAGFKDLSADVKRSSNRFQLPRETDSILILKLTVSALGAEAVASLD